MKRAARKTVCTMDAVSLLFGFALAFVPRSAFAEDYKTWTSADLYVRGAALTEKGIELERAIEMLSTLVARKPAAAVYHLALGSAFAARLGSLSAAKDYVRVNPFVQGSYKKRLAIWERMQNDPTLPLYGTPRPLQPPAPHTPDDEKVFETMPPDTDAQRTELTKHSLFHLKEACRLSRSFPIQRRIELDYGCGWGLLEVYRYGHDVVHYRPLEKPPLRLNSKDGTAVTGKTEAKPELKTEQNGNRKEEGKDELELKQAEIAACFEECTVYDKKRADYWQSLAFAYAPTYLSDSFLLSSPTHDDQESFAALCLQNQVEEADRCLRVALTRKRDDPDLLYGLVLINRSSRPEIALKDLTRLTTLSSNASFFYLLAQLHLDRRDALNDQKKTASALKEREAALKAIEAGNAAADYRMVPLALPVVRLLQKSWSYRPTYSTGADFRCLQTVSSFCRELAPEETADQDPDLIARVFPLSVGMGMNALKHYVGSDLDPLEPMSSTYLFERASYGMILLSRSQKMLDLLVKTTPTEDNLALANRYAGLKAYYKAWDSALYPPKASNFP